jgi:hypothetical protein
MQAGKQVHILLASSFWSYKEQAIAFFYLLTRGAASTENAFSNRFDDTKMARTGGTWD